jgi:hypothetical protein
MARFTMSQPIPRSPGEIGMVFVTMSKAILYSPPFNYLDGAMIGKEYTNQSGRLVFLSHPTQVFYSLPVDRSQLSFRYGVLFYHVFGQPTVDRTHKI